MLFDRSAHESLAADPWDEARVRAAVCQVVAEADRGYDAAVGCWRLHPLDAGEPDDDHAGVSHGVYLGAAGMLWGLERLERAGAAESSLDLQAAAAGLHGGYLRRCHAPDEPMPSLWLGEAGVHLVAETIAPGSAGPARADAMLAAVRTNAHNEKLDLIYGAAGTMLAAREMHRRTGEARWAEAWCESAEALFGAWCFDEQVGCHLWTQLLSGKSRRQLGAGHGFAGNVLALLDGLDLLPAARGAEIVQRATRAAVATAVTADGLANWPTVAGGTVDGSIGTKMQWCNGAPGIVCSLASLPADPELDAALGAGGELTWRAGPLAKGAGLCHGTAGNGFALLALFARTGDEIWLARSRAFAMHSLAQLDRSRNQHGSGRFSLWTGDLGTAIYAWQCIEGVSVMPALSAWSADPQSPPRRKAPTRSK